MSSTTKPFTCLIRTHHITSRKKLQRVRRAASLLNIHSLLVRTSGSPGIMFAQSHSESSLSEWVAAVHALRYKDFRCVARPALSESASPLSEYTAAAAADGGGFFETQSIAEFGSEMERRGLAEWWRRAMGYGPAV